MRFLDSVWTENEESTGSGSDGARRRRLQSAEEEKPRNFIFKGYLFKNKLTTDEFLYGSGPFSVHAICSAVWTKGIFKKIGAFFSSRTVNIE
jgi:hypothetical protein